MAEDVQDGKLDAPVPFLEGRAAGKQQGTAGARGHRVRKPSSVTEAQGKRGLTPFLLSSMFLRRHSRRSQMLPPVFLRHSGMFAANLCA